MKKHLWATVLALVTFGAFAEEPLTEKSCALAIAQALYDQCRSAYGDKTVLLTRESDVTLSYAQRADFVNNAHQDGFETLLVSIHLNQSLNAAAQGFEVFYSQGPDFAQSIVQGLEGEIGKQSPSRRINKADYFMLTHTKARTALVECGFISNPGEAALLAAPEYRQKIATGIGKGIARFIAENPTVAVIVIDPGHGGADRGAVGTDQGR